MTKGEWNALSEDIGDEVYEQVLAATGCGPFDGGCLFFANALRKALGGEVVALVREDDVADHAALYLDGVLIDFDGPADPEEFVCRFNANERAKCVGWRPLRDGDLPDAPTGDQTENDLAELLGAALCHRPSRNP